MKRKELKNRLWDMLTCIHISAELQELYLSQNCKIGGLKNHLSFVNRLLASSSQASIIFTRYPEEEQMLHFFRIDLLNEYLNQETEPAISEYYKYLYGIYDSSVALSEHKIDLKLLKEKENGLLCRLIQLHLTDETMDTFRRALTTLLLFSELIQDKDFVNQILSYYKNYKIN